jgi:large subunit ribosomal protein L4
MAKIDVLDVSGKKSGSRALNAELFEAPVNVPLMHQVVVAGLAGLRAGTHSTKTRGEVSGGGKKPWRQKGTGRARQGSIRAPQWSGGGVSHGPQPHDHEMRVNKKMKKGALRGALTDSLTSGKMAVVSKLAFEEPKTREAAEVLEAIDLRGKVLLVLDEPSDTGAIEKSFRNLRRVKVVYAPSIGVHDLLRADRILFTSAALDVIEGVAPSPDKTEPKAAPKPEPEPKPEAAVEADAEPADEPADEPEEEK